MEKELEKLLNSFKNDDIIIDKVEEYLDQNFIGKKEVKKILELRIRIYERFHDGDSENFVEGYLEGLKELLDLIK